MTELKPCPFCGGEAEFRIVSGEEYKALAVVCSDCGATGKKIESRLIAYMRPRPRIGEKTRLDHVIDLYGEDASEAWNRRVENG